ncbi:Hydrogenase expression/formation protein,HupF/HypC [Moorella glycerini]|uniref:Hydrogenase isoenzymes formation protein HypC n=1 Tax=Neomoorella stamsii TaxID=1266720 RepID=A0A9X7J5K9_9FIRM|nr:MULTISPECIES: HypC/HybG/HupF family hydrogenase formation chaperone [Moorella]PRR77592.1 Hydrogenase isoenzymes formation protein HypC [Moorella stamsii]CEP69361.1 Hydrogenase expression/formation protein,HupF/HypC [Moorella glycerini]
MCLGVPARIIAIDTDGVQATVETRGVQARVSLALVEGCRPGSYVLVHAGHAISIIDTEEAKARLSLWQELITFREEASLDANTSSSEL